MPAWRYEWSSREWQRVPPTWPTVSLAHSWCRRLYYSEWCILQQEIKRARYENLNVCCVMSPPCTSGIRRGYVAAVWRMAMSTTKECRSANLKNCNLSHFLVVLSQFNATHLRSSHGMKTYKFLIRFIMDLRYLLIPDQETDSLWSESDQDLMWWYELGYFN